LEVALLAAVVEVRERRAARQLPVAAILQALERRKAAGSVPDHEPLDVGSRGGGRGGVRVGGRAFQTHDEVAVVGPCVDRVELGGGIVIQREAPASACRHLLYVDVTARSLVTCNRGSMVILCIDPLLQRLYTVARGGFRGAWQARARRVP